MNPLMERRVPAPVANHSSSRSCRRSPRSRAWVCSHWVSLIASRTCVRACLTADGGGVPWWRAVVSASRRPICQVANAVTWAWSGPSGSPASVRASQRWNAALVSSRSGRAAWTTSAARRYATADPSPWSPWRRSKARCESSRRPSTTSSSREKGGVSIHRSVDAAFGEAASASR
jgi:hypothetical protein